MAVLTKKIDILSLFKFKVFSLLFLGLFLVGCGSGENGSSISRDITNAQVPDITVQPYSDTYNQGDIPEPLSVTAEVTDGGTLSYQWYISEENSNLGGDEIYGETDAKYTPSTYVSGTFYYYVVVTNTNNEVNGEKTADSVSSVAVITVVDPIVSAEPPIITEQPQSVQSVQYSEVTLSVTAEVKDGGELSYQWYTNDVNGNSEGEPIEGANEATYTLITSDEGIFYYYVVVTNSVTGLQKVNAASYPAVVFVNAVDFPPVINKITFNGAAYSKEDGVVAEIKKRFVLRVNAESTNEGVLTYQWYKDGEEISGATFNNYKEVPYVAGEYSYYVVVTNTKDDVSASMESDKITVKVE